MTTTDAPRHVTRPVRFFPPSDAKGKWHAARRVSEVAVCGSPAPLATGLGEWIAPSVGDAWTAVHPIVCRTCLRLTTSVGLAPVGTL
jgi:hypothetical protein